MFNTKLNWLKKLSLVSSWSGIILYILSVINFVCTHNRIMWQCWACPWCNQGLQFFIDTRASDAFPLPSPHCAFLLMSHYCHIFFFVILCNLATVQPCAQSFMTNSFDWQKTLVISAKLYLLTFSLCFWVKSEKLNPFGESEVFQNNSRSISCEFKTSNNQKKLDC